eukprot:gene19614-25521_t
MKDMIVLPNDKIINIPLDQSPNHLPSHLSNSSSNITPKFTAVAARKAYLDKLPVRKQLSTIPTNSNSSEQSNQTSFQVETTTNEENELSISLNDNKGIMVSPKKTFHKPKLFIDDGTNSGQNDGTNMGKYDSSYNQIDKSIGKPLDSEPGGLKRKPTLAIKIQDDHDWIQVSDDEDEDVAAANRATTSEKSPNSKDTRASLSVNFPQQSYLFTQSGTIFVDGFTEGIRRDGIVNITSPVNFTSDESGLFDINSNQIESPVNDSLSSIAPKIPVSERLVILCKLGQGASSVVYKALDLMTMKLVAIKMIPVFERGKRRQMVQELSAMFDLLRKKQEDQKTGHKVFKEILKVIYDKQNDSMRKTPSDFIVDFFDAFSNIDEGRVALMMEYMDGGSLQDIVEHGGVSDESTLATIAEQGLLGLAFLHSCSQLHRDLKPANFLISHTGDVKIADLGIMKTLNSNPDEQEHTVNIPTIGNPDGISRLRSRSNSVSISYASYINQRAESFSIDMSAVNGSISIPNALNMLANGGNSGNNSGNNSLAIQITSSTNNQNSIITPRLVLSPAANPPTTTGGFSSPFQSPSGNGPMFSPGIANRAGRRSSVSIIPEVGEFIPDPLNTGLFSPAIGGYGTEKRKKSVVEVEFVNPLLGSPITDDAPLLPGSLVPGKKPPSARVPNQSLNLNQNQIINAVSPKADALASNVRPSFKVIETMEGVDERTLPRTHTFVGTATYMSPERIDGKEYSFPSDIWGLGLSIMSVAMGQLPFDTSGGYWSILTSIRDEPLLKYLPEYFSDDFKDFLDKCLQRDPSNRLTAYQLLKHPFLKKSHTRIKNNNQTSRLSTTSSTNSDDLDKPSYQINTQSSPNERPDTSTNGLTLPTHMSPITTLLRRNSISSAVVYVPNNQNTQLSSSLDTGLDIKLSKKVDNTIEYKVDYKPDNKLDNKLDSKVDIRTDSKIDLDSNTDDITYLSPDEEDKLQLDRSMAELNAIFLAMYSHIERLILQSNTSKDKGHPNHLPNGSTPYSPPPVTQLTRGVSISTSLGMVINTDTAISNLSTIEDDLHIKLFFGEIRQSTPDKVLIRLLFGLRGLDGVMTAKGEIVTGYKAQIESIASLGNWNINAPPHRLKYLADQLYLTEQLTVELAVKFIKEKQQIVHN